MILTILLLCLLILCLVIPKINNKNTLRFVGFLFVMSCITLIVAVVLAFSTDSINSMEELNYVMMPLYVSGTLMLLAFMTVVIKICSINEIYCSINKKGRTKI